MRDVQVRGTCRASAGRHFIKRVVFTILVILALSGGAGRLLAHHSFAAEFDDKQPLKLTGTLTKVEWTNPHIWYYIDVKNPDGSITTWGLSGGAPGQLMRRGVKKDQLVVGSVVNVVFHDGPCCSSPSAR